MLLNWDWKELISHMKISSCNIKLNYTNSWLRADNLKASRVGYSKAIPSLLQMILRSNRSSLRVLYISVWLLSLTLVATYAASMAAQRLIRPTPSDPISTLSQLLDNGNDLRWFFIQNSSAIWKATVSPIIRIRISNSLEKDTCSWNNQKRLRRVKEQTGCFDHHQDGI